MNTRFVGRTGVLLILLSLLGGSVFRVSAQTNGIFADFVTSKGNFTCQLYYTNAPKAVANFIGLATGQRAWLDMPTGRVRNDPFYNGLKFHRVIPNFMIQGGSPNGKGTDGPGYVFPDEFSSSLKHDSPGVLSMANSGPKSNGSQFFITVEPTSWLDNVHTIFGRVVAGMDVVNAISQVATSTNAVPLTNVVIQQVNIRRVGAAAQAFNINSQGLPIVTNSLLGIAKQGSNLSLSFSNCPFAHNTLYLSTNLTSWTSAKLGIEFAVPETNRVVDLTDVPTKFYRLAQVQYASTTFCPKNLQNRTLTLTFSGGLVLTNRFDGVSSGTYGHTGGGTGTITGYAWSQEPYRGRLWSIRYSDFYPMTLQFDFSSSTNGLFGGGATVGTNDVSVYGTFTLK